MAVADQLTLTYFTACVNFYGANLAITSMMFVGGMPKLPTFFQAIHAAGAPTTPCMGFVDGNFRSCAMPTRFQEDLYSCYNRGHGITFQTIVAPNDLIIDFSGPVCGRRVNGCKLHTTDLEIRIARLRARSAAHFYLSYDPAYPQTPHILRGFERSASVDQTKSFLQFYEFSTRKY